MSVKFLDCQLDRVVEAIGVDAPAFGVATRLVETFHPASRTEEMLRGTGAEAIGGERIAPCNQLECFMRNHDVDEAGHRADRAVAVEGRNWCIGQRRPETN